MLATDRNNRKGGLAKDLLQRSVLLAKALGFGTIKTEATGKYGILFPTLTDCTKVRFRLH